MSSVRRKDSHAFIVSHALNKAESRGREKKYTSLSIDVSRVHLVFPNKDSMSGDQNEC